MSDSVHTDQLAVIRIRGMHCHKCEATLKRALTAHQGVHEVEVDFATGQASVLYTHGQVAIGDLLDSVSGAGYEVAGFSQGQAPGGSRSSAG